MAKTKTTRRKKREAARQRQVPHDFVVLRVGTKNLLLSLTYLAKSFEVFPRSLAPFNQGPLNGGVSNGGGS